MLKTTVYLSLPTWYVMRNQCWSKAWVHGRSLTRIVGSKPAGGRCVSLVSVVYCQAEVSVSG